jgi:hypothetical protein
MHQMQATFETVTPKLASAWLGKNTNNRPVSRYNVEKIASAISSGEWIVNGDAIRFDEDGNLMDGQHRLMGVVKSGLSINTLVVRDVASSAFMTIDTGKVRSSSDALGIAGESNTTALASMLRFVLQYEAGTLAGRSISNAQVIEAIGRHPAIRSWVVRSKQLGKITRLASPVGAVCYLASLSRPETAHMFMEELISGAGLQKGSPTLALRERLVQHKNAKARDTTAYMMQIVIHAYNAYARREPRSILKGDASTVSLPQIVGAPAQKVAA